MQYFWKSITKTQLYRDELQCMFNIQTSMLLKAWQNLFSRNDIWTSKTLLISHDSDENGNNYNHTNHAGVKCKLNLPYGPVCLCGCVCQDTDLYMYMVSSDVRIVAWLQWLFDIRPTGTQICRHFKVHNLIMCESKVQVVVSLGSSVSFVRPWELMRFDQYGTWHVTFSSNRKACIYLSWGVFITMYNVQWNFIHGMWHVLFH